jgi:hypothetical protein
MTYFLLETIAVPLASLATFLGLHGRAASQPLQDSPTPVAVASRPAEAAPVSAGDAQAASTVYPDYGYDSNSGWMTGAIAAFRAF